MVVKITFEGTVKRVYDETRGQYTSKYLVVADEGGKYQNVLRFKLKPDGHVPCGEGAKVKVSAYIDGREWTNQQGQVMYFTDLSVDTVEVLSQGSFKPLASAPAQVATDFKSLVALGAANGEDETMVRERCTKYQAVVNRRFSPDDYASIGREIVAAHAKPAAAPADDFNDDAPF